MEITSYLELLKKQRRLMTQQQISAIQEQARLHAIASEKMQIRDRLEERYREVFAKGFEKLSTTSNVLELLPDCDTDADRLKALIDCTQDGTAPFHDITAAMKTIPEFAECEKLNVEVGKAYYEFFCANDALNRRIDSDRSILFTPPYRKRMRQLADDGVFLYFLETPDLPLLEEECTSDYILESFSCAEYLSARELLSTFYQVPNPGIRLQRKLEDAHAALEMMYNGCYRSAAKNWFALIEHEHKRCADILEGYWEVKKEYKNGGQRSEKIYMIVNDMMGEWDTEAWNKIDSYYKKLTANHKSSDITLNRNPIIHGDYYSDAIDVSEKDALWLFLLWINLRVMTDRLAFIEDFIRNRVLLLPYFCEIIPSD